MNLTPLDDVLDKHFGKVGTPKRDAFESDVNEALHAYRLGEAIKKARIEQNLTQEQLGERIGVKRAQISKLEKGTSVIYFAYYEPCVSSIGHCNSNP